MVESLEDVAVSRPSQLHDGEGHAWTDHFLLGFKPIDDVHREFIELVAATLVCEDASLLQHLQAIERHAQSHFSTEAQWMLDTAFPAAQCHIDEHDKVLASVQQTLPLVADGQMEIGRSLAQALWDWFPGHADYMDSALAQWMVKRRHGGAPIVLRRHIQTT